MIFKRLVSQPLLGDLSTTWFIVDISFFSCSGDSYRCPPDLFRCDVIQCLSYGFVCNGEYNCQDKTDEANCSTAIINSNLCDITHSINCEQDILHSTRLADHGIKFEYIRPVQICIRRYGGEGGITYWNRQMPWGIIRALLTLRRHLHLQSVYREWLQHVCISFLSIDEDQMNRRASEKKSDSWFFHYRICMCACVCVFFSLKIVCLWWSDRLSEWYWWTMYST